VFCCIIAHQEQLKSVLSLRAIVILSAAKNPHSGLSPYQDADSERSEE